MLIAVDPTPDYVRRQEIEARQQSGGVTAAMKECVSSSNTSALRVSELTAELTSQLEQVRGLSTATERRIECAVSTVSVAILIDRSSCTR